MEGTGPSSRRANAKITRFVQLSDIQCVGPPVPEEQYFKFIKNIMLWADRFKDDTGAVIQIGSEQFQ